MKLNELSIEIIKTCPNKCLFCSSKSTPESKEILNLETIKKIVTDAKTLGAKSIHLSGGEPFMHPEILEIAEFTKSLGLALNIYTSGITIEQSKYSYLNREALRNLKLIGVDKLIFDVQAASSELYNTLMGTTGQFKNLLKSIEQSNKLGFWTEFHYIPTKLNEADFENVLKLALSSGAKGVSVLRFVNQGRGRENQKVLEMSMEELIAFRDYAKSLMSKYKSINIRVGHPMLLDNKVTHMCTAGVGKLVVTFDGLVYPCESFKWVRGLFYQNDFEEGYFEPESVHDFSLESIYTQSWFLVKLRKEIDTFKGRREKLPNEIFMPLSNESIACQKISHFERKLYKKEDCLFCE